MPIRTPQQILGQFQTTPEREKLKVRGAVRVAGTPQVYTLGEGGRPIKSPQELLQQGFRENEVLEISPEEARSVGITADFGTLPKLQPPQTPQIAPETSISPLGEVISKKAEEDPRKAIIDQLTKTFQDVAKGIGMVDYGARFKELREEAGLGGISQRIGTLDTEIAKTEDLLKNLEQDILERSKEELVTAGATRRLEAVERAPLVEQLGELSRARGIESGLYERGREDILTRLGLEKGERSDMLSQLQTATQIAGLQQNLMQEGIETQIVDKGTSKVLINKNTGKVIQEFDVTKAPEEISELDKVRIEKIRAEITKIKKQTTDEGGNGLAKNYFSETQIARGAKNANMSIKEFGNLPVDRANQFIQGSKIIDGQVRNNTDLELQGAIDNMIAEAMSQNDMIDAVLDDTKITPSDKIIALQYIDEKTKKGFWGKLGSGFLELFK